MARTLAALDKKWDVHANHIFYLALPPSLIGDVVKELAAAKLNGKQARIVVEKPFGNDLESARELNSRLGEVFKEESDLSNRPLPRQRDRAEYPGLSLWKRPL